MDAGAFMQENKRWVLGAVIGLLVYWIGSSVIASTYDVGGTRAAARKLSKLPQGNDQLYGDAQLQAAREQQQALRGRLQELRQELEYRPEAEFVLQGQSMSADDYLAKIGTDLRDRLRKAADLHYVQLVDKGLSWPNVTDPDGVRAALLGLSMLQQTASRLFKAHEQTQGLLAINQLAVADQRRQASFRPSKAGAVTVQDLLDEQKINLEFQSDAPTADLFLESCRQVGRTLVLESLNMTQGKTPGDPVTVKAVLRGIVFKEQKQ